MKRGWWLVGVLLAWTSCGSSSAKPPVDAAATADAAPAAPDGSAGSDAAVDTVAATDGAADAGSDGTDATLAAASTWTGIYGDLFTNPANPSNCMGLSCYDPGIQKGIDLSYGGEGVCDAAESDCSRTAQFLVALYAPRIGGHAARETAVLGRGTGARPCLDPRGRAQ